MSIHRFLLAGLCATVVISLTLPDGHSQPAPADFTWTEANVGAAFDQMWQALDRHYSYFTIKPNVDWAKLRDQHRPKAIQAKSVDELTAVLKEMLGQLNDVHVWIVKPGGAIVGTWNAPWTFNGNGRVIVGQLTDLANIGPFAIVGKTKVDGFGYFIMKRQTAATPDLVAQAVKAIEARADVPGFIMDLRSADGGNELLAQEIARVFNDKPVVYAKSRARSGPKHDDFTPDRPRTLPAAKSAAAYTKPVVCLLGPGCISSGEGFAKMLAMLPHVTTVGLPTRGASGNPGPVELGSTGIKVMFSRWADSLPDGTPTEGKGVQPAIRFEAQADEYKTADPTLEKGLEVLRTKVKPIAQPPAVAAEAWQLVSVVKIWDEAPHNAFTDLVRHKDRWYCTFREGAKHVSPDGAIRVLTSADGATWESAARITSATADLRDPKLCVTPSGQLMLTTAGALHQPGEVRHQTFAWFSPNGRSWGEPTPIGEPNYWLWRVVWHAGAAYGVGYDTTSERDTRLYRSTDGRAFTMILAPLAAIGRPNEAGMVFALDDSCICLLRRDGAPTGLVGTAKSPYTKWEWKDLDKSIGGPQLLRLPDGRLVAGGRLKDGTKVRTALCLLDPATGRLDEKLSLPSGGDTSYPGLVWQDGQLWVSYYSSHEGKSCVYLARVKVGG